jgi:metallo-beta-lactamase class B
VLFHSTFLILLGLFTATVLQAQPRSDVQSLGDDLLVRRLTGTVWVHTSRKAYNGVQVPANGLVIVTSGGSILVDTPYDTSQTRRLLRWATTSLRSPVRVAVVTHAHEDRMGGIRLLKDAAIPVHALALTSERAAAKGWPLPDSLFTGESMIRLGDRTIDLYHPGAAHAPDNITIWLAEEKILFGGCLIKAANDNTLGFVGDADLPRWAEAIGKVTSRYTAARVIVPGHGDVGDRNLLLHTLELLQRR